MKQTLLLIHLTLTLTIFVSAQKQTCTSNDTINQIDKLNGIETYLESSMPGRTATNSKFPLYLGYFSEFRLTPVSTAIFSIGTNITPGTYLTDSAELYTGYSYHGGYIQDTMTVNYCQFTPKIGIEPRWYWTFSKRALSGKAKLNSGWFLSLPIQILIPLPLWCTPALDLQPPHIESLWIKDYFAFHGLIGLSVGFRQALSNHWLIEAACGLQANNHVVFNKSNDNYFETEIAPELKITAAYVFK
jgi:hypothetical protein